MRFVIQRVSSASVTIDGKVRGEIGKGFVVLIGIGEDDTKEIADKLLSVSGQWINIGRIC